MNYSMYICLTKQKENIMTKQELQQAWELKQDRIQYLIDMEIQNPTEEIEKLELEIHELMRLHWELD